MTNLAELKNSNEFVPYRMVKRTLDGRLLILRNAIHDFLANQSNAIVIDVGTGGGLLAAWAAECETVTQVYAIEDDPLLLAHTRKALANHPHRNRITILTSKNLLSYIPPETCDLLLCEVISTALIEQPQAPLVNYYRQFLKATGAIIPDNLVTMITLLNFDFNFYNSLISIPAMFDAYVTSLPETHFLSEPSFLNHLSFYKPIPDHTDTTVQIQATESGWVRSVMLQSQISIGHKNMKTPNSICHPLVSPIDNAVFVEKGQTLNVRCSVLHQTIDDNGKASARVLPKKINVTLSTTENNNI